MKAVKKRWIAGAVTMGLCVSMSFTGAFADTLLKIGSRGDEVSQVQTILKDKQLFTANVTGYYGEITKWSVIQFQQMCGLSPDGIVGPLTRQKLYQNQTGNGGGTNVENTQINQDDLYWMSRIIHAEAQGESYEGKVAVGSAIMNRVRSSQFPNTIKGVIFEKSGGYIQYTPVATGTIYNTPNADSVKAAKAVLGGTNNIGPCTYFLNPAKSTNNWIIRNKKFYKRIGNHSFYY